MTFKEFTAWCNERACDGRWNMLSAMVCIDLMAEIRKIPFWKRERVWREQHEKQVLAKIVDPLNQKIPINELARRTSHTPETTTSEKEHPTMSMNTSPKPYVPSRTLLPTLPPTFGFWMG